MYIKSVAIENVLSIENASICFPDSGLLLIDGWNHDTESANGAGKSAIFHALSWGLYGQYPRGVSITDFVRQGSRVTKVTADIELSANRILRIERCRPKSFYASINDVEISESEYEKILPLDYEQFIVAQYFAQGLGTRFLDLNDSGRKDLILKLMRADGFADGRKKIDQDLKALNLEKNNIVNALSALDGKLSAFKESQVDVNLLRHELKKLEDSIASVAPKINQLATIQPPDDVDKYSELIEKLNIKLREISTNGGRLRAYRQQLRDLEREQEPCDSSDGSCPSCGAELDIVSGRFVRHDSSSAAEKINAHRQQILSKKESLTSLITGLEGEVGKEQSILDTILSLKKKIKDSMSEYDAAQNRLNELKNFYKEKDLERKSILKTIDQQDDLSVKIKNIELSIEKSNELLHVKDNDILKLEAASMVLSPTGAPAYVMDSVIQTLNDRIQEIIQLIWPNSSYELLSFKENKSGSITSKMSDSLTIDGAKRPVGSLSGGERRCLSLSIDFAIAEVVSRYTGAQLNPLILDEPFDHLDASNRSRVIEFLKEMATKRCIVVIDHASEAKALFDQSITIVKRNGVSTVS
jgi:DNA repair exonuclease SbcCD ATPase subunit